MSVRAAKTLASAALPLLLIGSVGCVGSRSWQPHDREIADAEEARTDQASRHGALEPYYLWLRTELGTTWASWDVRYWETSSGQVTVDPLREIADSSVLPAASLRVRSLSAPQADGLIRKALERYGCQMVRVIRSARYSPASWDIELHVSGERDSEDAQSARLAAEYIGFMHTLAGAEVKAKLWLDALSLRSTSASAQVRLQDTAGERDELYGVYRALVKTLAPQAQDYRIRQLGDEERVVYGWTMALDWTLQAEAPKLERHFNSPFLWAPESSRRAPPVRDSNDAMRGHPMER